MNEQTRQTPDQGAVPNPSDPFDPFDPNRTTDEQLLQTLFSQIPAYYVPVRKKPDNEFLQELLTVPLAPDRRRPSARRRSWFDQLDWRLDRRGWVRYAGRVLLVVAVLIGGYLVGSATLAVITIQRNLHAMQLPTAGAPGVAAQEPVLQTDLTIGAVTGTPVPLPTLIPETVLPPRSTTQPGPISQATVPFAPNDATAAAQPPGAGPTATPTALPTLTPLPVISSPTPIVLPSLGPGSRAGAVQSSPVPAAPSAPAGGMHLVDDQVSVGETINILLMGVDQRPTETYPARTDAIMIAHIDPQSQRVALLSLPRDLIVEIPGYGSARINAASVYGAQDAGAGGGIALLRETVSSLLGIPIDYIVRVDFMGFIGAVDAIGGITINVEQELYDPYYPTMDYGYIEAHFLPGPQHMDGATALVYSRIRHMDSDFERMRRQQQVVLGVLERVREQHALKQLQSVAAITTALRGYVQTDMPQNQMLELARAFKDFSPKAIERYTLDENMVMMAAIPDDPYAQLALPGTIEALVAQMLNGPAPVSLDPYDSYSEEEEEPFEPPAVDSALE